MALALSCAAHAAAQGLPAQWAKLNPSWETRLEAGDGQKVRQEAEALLANPAMAIRESSYNDLHAKVGVLCIAARGAVLEGDWQGAVSLLGQAVSAAKAGSATADVTLMGLRKQHEAKMAEWKELMVPQEEQLRWLQSQPGLRSEQIRQYSDIEAFLAEHRNAISHSEQSIKEMDNTLSLLKSEEETCSRSLEEWNWFLARERAEIQEIGSEQRYVAEKLAQVIGDAGRPRFERIAYTRRLQRLDPANAAAKEHLNLLLGVKKAGPAAPAKKKAPAKAAPKKSPANAAAGGGQADPGKDAKGASDKAAPAPGAAQAAQADQTKAEPTKADTAKAEAPPGPGQAKSTPGKIHPMD